MERAAFWIFRLFLLSRSAACAVTAKKELGLLTNKTTFEWLQLASVGVFVTLCASDIFQTHMSSGSLFQRILFHQSLLPPKTPTNVSALGAGCDPHPSGSSQGRADSLPLAFPCIPPVPVLCKCLTIHYTVTCKAAIPFSADSTNHPTAGS